MINTITKIGIAVALIVIMYQEALILNQTAEIKEAVVETNEIVKEIRLHNTPYDLNKKKLLAPRVQTHLSERKLTSIASKSLFEAPPAEPVIQDL